MEPNMNPERNPVGKNPEDFDAEGNPRKTFVMPDDTTFHGSEKEYQQALVDYRENKDKEN